MARGREVNVEAVCELVESLHGLAREFKGRIFLGTFPSEVRPEHAAVEEATSCIAGRVANRSVIIGAQSGSDEVLLKINRGHDAETVVEAVETLNKYGFVADVDFIFGMPQETPEDMEASVDLAETLVSRYRARIHAHYYLPLPGTPIDHLDPKPIPERVFKRLLRLLGKGLLYGDWLKQVELSRGIVELRRRGVIVGLRGWREIRKSPEPTGV